MKAKHLTKRSFMVVFTTILLLIAIPATAVFAASAGPNYPGTATGGAGNNEWVPAGTGGANSLVGALGADGGRTAMSDVEDGDDSDPLVMTNFGFSIPAGATIDGITVEMNRYREWSTGGGIQDVTVRLLGGTLTGDNKAEAGLWATTFSPDNVDTFGSASDTWGNTWTPAQINATGFGVELVVENTHSSARRQAHVDYVRITVTYTEAAKANTTTTVTCDTPVTYGGVSTCTATVARDSGTNTPSGNVTWGTDGSGSFGTSSCSSPAAGTLECSADYTPSAVGTGTHNVSATYAGDSNFNGSNGNQNVTVNTKALVPSFTADNKEYDGDTDADILTRDVTGVINADDVSLTGGTASFADANVGAGKTVTGSGFALSGANAGNYHLDPTSAQTTADITAKAINVTADPQSKTYGDADPALTYTADALVGSDLFSGALERAAGEDVGPYAINQGTLTAGSNYTINYTGANLTIGVRGLTVTANNKTIFFGSPEPVFDYTPSGFQFSDDFVTEPTCAVVQDPHTAVGVYDIVCSGADAGSNYSISYVDGVYTISDKVVLDVSVANASISYGDALPSFTPLYSGFTGGDDASALDTAPTCSATGGPFTAVGSPYAIVCSGGVDNKYDFNYTNGELTVNPLAITVTADAGQMKAEGDADPAEYTYSVNPALVGSDTFSGALTRELGETPGFYAILVGTLSAGANYDMTFVSNNFEIVANQAPVITEGADIGVTMSKNGFPDKFALTLNATDAEDHTLTWSIQTQAGNGTATASGDGNSKVIAYAPTLNFSGADSFVVRVTDQLGAFDDITVNVTVSAGGDFPTFVDVPMANSAWSYIESIYYAGITGGCSTNPLAYCPNSSVTRAQMAIFLLRGMYGQAYTPPPATGTVFADVPLTHSAAAWIEQLAAEGITGGCGGGNYCPSSPVTRAQMAIFLLRAKYGQAYTPPAATGTEFLDVPIGHSAAAWIEQLAAEGITGGCGGGNYCPNNSVTRAQMAIFIQRTFDLARP
ncbi:MAG: MBG domain-containing protein [Anaerolineales bacterium]|nr:MAG: MBG domain-containing protein [Anaerolineales bacterium]